MCRFEIAIEDVVIQRGAVFGSKGVNVFLGEEEMAEIKRFEVTGEKLFRDLIVKRMVCVMPFLKKATDGKRDLLIVGLGEDRLHGERDDHQTW
jgi:hypothetical protein